MKKVTFSLMFSAKLWVLNVVNARTYTVPLLYLFLKHFRNKQGGKN